MKKLRLRWLIPALALAATACTPRETTLVLLSTNDIHAQIDRIPMLASAVAACRDTTDRVVLIDAGDRWTGNPYVDRTPVPGLPVIRLMNRLGYDVATLGNHEFDHGQAHLGRIIDSMHFPVICANVVTDTCTFPQLLSHLILKRGNLRIGLVGAVTNYEGPGHPAGQAASFVGLRFPDPQERAMAVGDSLRPFVDLLVLVSHMGDDRDEELLRRGTPYDVVIGGHTHEVRNSVVEGTLLTQTGKNLINVGVTTVRMRGRKVVDTAFRLIELSDYPAAEPFASEVIAYAADPELNKPAGAFRNGGDKLRIGQWIARSLAATQQADLGFYHRGGVRLDTIPAGPVSRATIYALEPFNSTVVVAEMTPEQLRRIILAKYNDTNNLKEAHRIDLIASTPYEIITDEEDNALDVRFPQLKEGRVYRMAYNDYVFKNYAEVDRSAAQHRADVRINELLLNELSKGRPLAFDEQLLQRVVTVVKCK